MEITDKEEYFCWVYAHTNNWNASSRVVYGPRSIRPISPKLRDRVAYLKELDALGEIDLARGPWYYYGWDIGDPSLFEGKRPLDYGELCRKRKNLKNSPKTAG